MTGDFSRWHQSRSVLHSCMHWAHASGMGRSCFLGHDSSRFWCHHWFCPEYGFRVLEWQRMCLIGNLEITTQHHLLPSWLPKAAVDEHYQKTLAGQSRSQHHAGLTGGAGVLARGPHSSTTSAGPWDGSSPTARGHADPPGPPWEPALVRGLLAGICVQTPEGQGGRGVKQDTI